MKYEVVLTDRAFSDLEEGYLWYAQRAPNAATRWYNGFLDAIHSLAENPERCSFAAENAECAVELRQLLYGRRRTHRAIFLIRERAVVVLHIRHTARRNAKPEELL